MSHESDRAQVMTANQALTTCIQALADLDASERTVIVETLCSFYQLNPSPRLSDLVESILEIIDAVGEKLPPGLFDMLKGAGVGAQPVDPEAIRAKLEMLRAVRPPSAGDPSASHAGDPEPG